jgi:VIT1/CCC1 family predicted Fe2+/Mn2+ transporter
MVGKFAYYVGVALVGGRILFLGILGLVLGILSGIGIFPTIILTLTALTLGIILNIEKMMNLSVKKRQL